MSIDAQTVRKIIKEELPQLVKSDPAIRQLIIDLLKKEDQPENRSQEREQLCTEIESHLLLISGRLRREAGEYKKKLEENREEIQTIRKDIVNNMEEINRIYRLLNLFDKDQELSLGGLNVNWGY